MGQPITEQNTEIAPEMEDTAVQETVSLPETVPEQEQETESLSPSPMESTTEEEPIVRPVEEIPPIKTLAEESSPRKSKSTKKRRKCPVGKHRSKKNRCKKIASKPTAKECPPHTFRSAASHRCRHKCSKKYRYNKSKKRCVRKKTE